MNSLFFSLIMDFKYTSQVENQVCFSATITSLVIIIPVFSPVLPAQTWIYLFLFLLLMIFLVMPGETVLRSSQMSSQTFSTPCWAKLLFRWASKPPPFFIHIFSWGPSQDSGTCSNENTTLKRFFAFFFEKPLQSSQPEWRVSVNNYDQVLPQLL